MKNIVIPFLTLVLTAFVFGQSNSWKTLTPLVSTRTDVEKLLGKSKESNYRSVSYETSDEQVSVKYIAAKCKEGWYVPKDRVLSISVSPNSYMGKSLEELKLDKSNFFVTGDDAFYGTWTNPELGLQYYFGNIEREFRSVTYIPKKSDNKLRCNGFPPFAPEGQHHAYNIFDFQNEVYNKKENLSRIYEIIGSFTITTNNFYGNNYKGYVLAYFDNKLSLKEYRLFLSKIKTFIFKNKKVPADKIFVIEGGLREKAEIELYILPKDYKPPTPNPTLPSPQFMK